MDDNKIVGVDLSTGNDWTVANEFAYNNAQKAFRQVANTFAEAGVSIIKGWNNIYNFIKKNAEYKYRFNEVIKNNKQAKKYYGIYKRTKSGRIKKKQLSKIRKLINKEIKELPY